MDDIALKRQVRSGGVAIAGAQIVAQVWAMIALAVLIHWVDPDQFGLLAMALPLVIFLRQVAAAGLHAAAIQREELGDDATSVLFWMQISYGFAAGGLIAAVGTPLAWWWSVPQLAFVFWALAGTAPLAALGMQHQALLERQFSIGRVTASRVAAQIIAGLVAVAVAVAGGGVWALIAREYVEQIALAAFVWRQHPWRPRWPHARLLRFAGLSNLMAFGGYYSASSLAFTVAQQCDKFLFAMLVQNHQIGMSILGMYHQLWNLSQRPTMLVAAPVTGVMLPSLARARAEQATFAELTTSFYRLCGATLFPAGMGLAVVGPDFIRVLSGDRWEIVAGIMAPLGLAILGQGFINIAGSVFAAAGKTDRLLFGSLIVVVAFLIGYGAATWIVNGGPFAASPAPGDDLWPRLAWAMAATYAGITVALAIPYSWFCLRTAQVPAWPVALKLLPSAAAAGGMGLLCLVLQRFLAAYGVPPVGRLLLVVPAGGLIYLLLARGEVAWMLRQFRRQET